MKLRVKEVGADVERDVDIRNPKATVANLRAAIAVYWKIKDVNAFRLTATGLDLENASRLLSDIPLKDGDVVFLATKRGRDGDEVPEAEPQTSLPASTPAVPQPRPAAEPPTAPPTANDPQLQRLLDMGFLEAEARTALQAAGGESSRAMELLLGGSVPGVRPGDAEEAHDGDLQEEDEEGEVMDEDEEGEEMTPEEEEQGELAMRLLALGHPRELAQQFLANPQQVLSTIQREQPELFALIGRHNQFFLDLVNSSASMPDDDEEIEELEGDEEDDDEDDDDDDDEDHEAPNHIYPALARGRGRSRGHAAAGAGGRGAGAPTAAPTFTEAEEAQITSLMQLGFTRDQCVTAYLRSGRNVERAGNYLFEHS